VVAVGDIIRVKVLQVDLERRRIALSRKQAGG
jgi:ribosomal protein S1